MKKLVLGFAFVAVAAVSFTSCEKCTTCEIDGAPYGDEFCGKSDEVDAYEETAEAAAALLGSTADCTRD